MSAYLTWEDTARYYADKGAAEDTDVVDCQVCGVLWDQLRETHRCQADR